MCQFSMNTSNCSQRSLGYFCVFSGQCRKMPNISALCVIMLTIKFIVMTAIQEWLWLNGHQGPLCSLTTNCHGVAAIGFSNLHCV